MTRRITALALAVLLPVLLGAAKCEEGQQHPSAPRVPQVPRTPAAPATGRAPVPDPHAGDPQPSGHEERTITVRVGGTEHAFLPTRILIAGRGTEPPSVSDVMTSDGPAIYTLTYDAKGEGPVNIRVRVTPTVRGSSSTWCEIAAGAAGNDPRRFILPDQVRLECFLTIRN